MKNKKLLKIIAGIVGILLIFTPVLYLVNLVFSNPITIGIVKHNFSQYVKEVYDYNGEIYKPNYQFPYGYDYTCYCEINSERTQFSIEGNYITDYNVSKYYGSLFENDLISASEFLPQGDTIIYSTLDTKVKLNGNYSENVSDMEKSQCLYLTIRLNSTESTTLDKAEIIYNIINYLGEKYSINSYNISFLDDNYKYEYSTKKIKNISVENINKTAENKSEKTANDKLLEQSAIY